MEQARPHNGGSTDCGDDQIVYRLATQFSAAWQEGQRPTIESFLEQVPAEAGSALLTELVRLEIAFRQQAGEKPTASEYLARFPADRVRLEGFFAALNLNRRSTIEVEPHATLAHANAVNVPVDRSDGRSSVGAHGLKVRCPHCHNPIELVDSDSLQELTCPSCGSSFSLVEGQSTNTYAQPTVKQLGHFELVERLGMGAFGTVWKARDTELDRIVAIKIPRADRLAPEEIEKFFREARAAAQLRHPSIVSVHEVGRDGDTVYIVSDLVRGVTLSDWLSGQQLTPREAAELCAQVADALHHAHEQGVIHRDLKPGNIMLDADGRPHLMDFGLAKREAGEITMTVEGQVLGTPAYMSPEQARGEGHAVDRRADVYSLGVILFQLLTGELPFRGTPRMLLHQVLNDEPRSPRSLNDRLPRDLETICLKAMAKEPNRRYATAKALHDDLRRYVSGDAIQARPVGRMERSWRWAKRNSAIAGLVAAALLLLFGVAVVGTVGYVQTSAALSREEEARRQAQANLEQAEYQRKQAQQANLKAVEAAAKAQAEARTAQEVSAFLAGMFEASSPFELGPLLVGGTKRTTAAADLTAMEMLDRGAEKVLNELSKQPEVQADLLDVIVSVYLGISNWEAAGPLLHKSLEIRRSLGQGSDQKAASTLYLLAVWSHHRGDIDAGQRFARESYNIVKMHFSEDSPEVVRGKMALGLALCVNGDTAEESQRLLREVLNHFERTNAEDSIDYAVATLMLCGALSWNVAPEDFQERDRLLPRAVNGLLAHSETERLATVMLKAVNAILVFQSGNYEAAATTGAKALAELRELLGVDHWMVAWAVPEVARIFEQVGQFEQAEAILLETEQAWQQPDRWSHPLFARIVMYRAALLCRRGDHTSGEALIDRVLAGDADRGTYLNCAQLSSIAWIMATDTEPRLRNGGLAVKCATLACEVTRFKNWGILDTLAAAYAESGDFEKAIEWQTKAIELAKEGNRDYLRSHLDLYKSRQAFRQ